MFQIEEWRACEYSYNAEKQTRICQDKSLLEPL